MRLNLVIQRHGLPITRILWTTSLPSFLGGSALGSSYVPASSSVIASSRAPNAAYANGYTIAQLLEDVNEVVPLETGVDLGGDGHSGVWGLEDYVVEVGGFECLHFMEVEGLLRDGDEVVIRALQTSDLRARRLSGRHQISVDGRHLIDGVPFGRSFLKRSTSSRPAIAIPPRKRRRTTLSNWQLPDTYGAEGEDCAPLGHEDTDRSLANDEYVDEGTVIRHNVEADEDSQLSESDADYAEDEEENLQEELSGLKEDMETSGLRGDIEEDEQRASAGYALRLRSSSGEEPSDEVPAQSASPATTLSVAEKQPGMDFRPRALRLRSSSRPKALSKSPAANPPSIVSSAARSSRTDYSPKGSKLVRFRNENKEPLPPTSLKKGAYASGQPLLARAVVPGDEVEPTLSDSTSSTSVSSDTSSNEDDSELESEIEEATETEEEDSMSETDDDSTSELEAVSKSEDEEMSESEVSEDEAVPTVVSKGKPRPETSAPGNGSLRTKKNNRRCKLRRRLSKLKELGALPPNADFAALRAWESANGRWYEPPETKPPGTEDTYAEASAKKKEQEEFEEKRQKLLRQLESGGIDMDGISEEDRVSPPALEEDTQMTTETAEEVGAQPVNEAEARLESELSKRRTLDLASSKRLLFGSLGVRAPRSKEEEEVTRKKLAGKANHFQSRRRSSVPDSAPEAEGDLEVNWQDKLVIKATECIFDDIELTAPPFPFEQRWDSEAHGIIRQRKGRGKGKKRRRRARIYEEESWEEDYENGFNGYENGDVQLNYDDTEQTNDDENSGNAIEVEQNSKPPKSPSEDLPVLSDDLSSVPDLVESEIKLGSIIAYKQLDMSKATNWQPKVSDYRVAEVHEVLEDGVAKVRLAKRDRMKPVDNADEDGPREYSGFEMPGYEDNETEDDGFREVSFGELIEPKLLRPAARTDPDAAEPEDAQGVDMSCDAQDSAGNLPTVDSRVDSHNMSTVQEIQDTGRSAQVLDRIELVSNNGRRNTHDDSEQGSDSVAIRSPEFVGFESSPAPDTTLGVDKGQQGGILNNTSSPGDAKEDSREISGSSSLKPNAVDAAQSSPHSPMPSEEDADQNRQRDSSPERNLSQFERMLGIFNVERSVTSSPQSLNGESHGSDGSQSPSEAGSSPSGSNLEMIGIGSQPDRRDRTESRRSGSALLNPTQTSEVVHLTGPSPPASPALEIECDPEYTESPRLPNGPGWVQKSKPASRQHPRPSMRRVQTLKEVSISPPQKRSSLRKRMREKGH